jgi:16S rRNA (adenine1518-N6/adenine1519-N6)-dimethyltransferase
MTLGEMRQLLGDRNIQLTKSLGQNFLHDQNQLRRIVAAAELCAADHVLEIGPGLGPLTEMLLASAVRVFAIEKDARLVAVLKERFAGNPKLELLHADALDVVSDHTRGWSEFKLVANLPYSVASPILVELAQNPRRPERLVATLQLEVARRLMAHPGDDDYGLLTLLLQLRYKAVQYFKIPRGCFFPEPDVDSACIVSVRRSAPLLPEERHAAFDKIVKRGLSQRRKKLVKLLKADWPEPNIVHALEALKVPADVRGEKLSLEQFVELTNLLSA